MIANALLATTVVCVALLFWLMQSCPFLIPYRTVLLRVYGPTLAVWAGVFFVNVFAVWYALSRALFLKDTGRKLAHVEKQMRPVTSLADELQHRLDG
jgi:hypothetical protein